jgi:hypothetical protein
MALILEVLDGRGGGVRTRIRLDALPLRIGRALDNDLILDDPYADAQHAQITRAENGDLVVEDTGSINGVILAGGLRVTRAAVGPGMEIRVGRSLLRLRDPAQPVPPALPDAVSAASLDTRWAARPRVQVAFSLIAVAILALAGWLDSYERSAAEDAFTSALGFATMGALWAGIWAVAGRIVVHRFRFFAHFSFVTLFLMVAFLLGSINEWTVFLFPDNPIPVLVGAAIGLVMVATLVAGHLGLASALPSRRRWQAGAAVSLVILALATAGAVLTSETFSDVPEFAGTVKAVGAGWLPTHTVAEFGEVTSQLQHEVDALLEK